MKKIIYHIGKLLWMLLVATGNVISDLTQSLVDMLEKREGFQAKFGTETLISSRFNLGFFVSKHRRLTRKMSYENLLIAGPTGSGKTTTILTKTIWELKDCSIIINDPSEELHKLTSGGLSQTHLIKILNYSNSSKSSGHNILNHIVTQTDAHKVAEMLVASNEKKGHGGGDPFWGLQSQALITLFIQLLLHQQKKYRNMANLVDLVNRFASSPKAVDRLVVHTGDAKLLSEYKALISFPQRTLQNIVASVKASLKIFTDDEAARVTSFDSINFAELRMVPTVLFIHNSVGDQRYFSTLNAIFFEQLYGYLLSELPNKDALDVFFVLEEASSLYIPLLPLALANLRKYRSGTIVCTQSPSQLKTLYGNDFQNIVTNCQTKIYLAGQTDPEVLHHLETLGGKYVSTDKKGIDRITNLISADEIRLLEKNRSLIVSSNNPLIKGRVSPYYESAKYRAYASIPPLPLVGDIPEECLSLLLYDLEHADKAENQKQKAS